MQKITLNGYSTNSEQALETVKWKQSKRVPEPEIGRIGNSNGVLQTIPKMNSLNGKRSLKTIIEQEVDKHNFR